MHVAELWRYPVKSLRGQALERADIGPEGIPDDRGVVVVDAKGELLTARTKHALLGLRTGLDREGEPTVDGHRWSTDEALRSVRLAAGPGTRLERRAGLDRFDDTPLLVATDGAVAWMGVDGRRFRPNIVIGGVEGLAEREWPGRQVRMGGALIAVERVCKRCVMTTLDPDTMAQDPDVLRRINEELDGRFALNCTVVERGPVAVGDPVKLV